MSKAIKLQFLVTVAATVAAALIIDHIRTRRGEAVEGPY